MAKDGVPSRAAWPPAGGLGSPMTNQLRPWFDVSNTRPAAELIMIWLRLSGLTAKLRGPVSGHCGSGGGVGLLCWSRPKVRPMSVSVSPAEDTRKKSVFCPPQQGHLYVYSVPDPT